MSAKSTYYFGDRRQYCLRPATHRDDLLAARWTEADPDHRHMDPDFWLEQLPGCDSYLLFDGGCPLFFFKTQRQYAMRRGEGNDVVAYCGENVELHIQFGPFETLAERKRTARGLREGMAWLENRLSGTSVNALVFHSAKPELIKLCVRKLGFKSEGGLLTKSISKRVEVT